MNIPWIVTAALSSRVLPLVGHFTCLGARMIFGGWQRVLVAGDYYGLNCGNDIFASPRAYPT